MNRKSKFALPLKIISCILCFTLIFQTVQISASAFTINDSATENNEADSPSAKINDGKPFSHNEAEEAVIIAEDISKREETVKHFYMSDGTTVAAQYDRPVHFLKDDSYTDYDNTLIEVYEDEPTNAVSESGETKEISDEAQSQLLTAVRQEETESEKSVSAKGSQNKELTNRCADFSVRFSKKSNGKKLVRFEKDGYKISWYYIGGAKTNAEVITSPADDGDPTTLERLTSAVVYKNVFGDTDIEYTVSSDGIKENIILNKATAPSEFSVEYRANGLVPVAESDKKIVLRNESGEDVLVLYAPYMTDANGEVSTGITLSVTDVKNGKFVLKTELDGEWLRTDGRAFPVTVDPLMQTEQLWTSTTQAHSAYIASDTPNSCYGRGGNSYEGCVYVGKEPGRGKTRALIKCPSLPRLKTADKVVHAELAMYSYACYPEIRAELHRVTSAWEQNTVCWNTGVTYDPSIADYQMVQYMETTASGKDRWQRFEITELVKGWYSNEYANNGVILISPSENSSDNLNRAMFFANGYPDATSIRPFLLISYRNMAGYEDYWSFTSMPAGRNGTASINNYNGNFVFTQPLTNDNGGLLMPVNIALVFNSNQKEYKATGFGTSMYLNYDMRLYRETNNSLVDNGYRYYLRDADGTEHWFRFESASDNKAKDEDGLGYTIDLYPAANVSWYSVTDKDGTVMYFDSDQRLVRIIDKQGNAANLTYETVSGIKRIKTITDGANRNYSFEYDSSGRCTKITDPAHIVTAIEYKNANNNYYITNIRFQHGTAEEQYINFNYDGSFINQITGVDKTIVRSTYDVSNTQYRANSLRYFGTDNTELERYTLVFKQNETTVTDKYGKAVTYQFNDFGQTTGIVDNDEKTANYYRWNGGNSTRPTANKLLSESKAISSASNLVRNPGFTRSYTDGFSFWNENDTGTKTAEIDTGKGALTKNSVKLTKTNDESGFSLIYQRFDNLTPNTAYTASGYINTAGKTLSGDGPLFAVEIWQNGQNLRKVYSEKTLSTGTNEWKRVSVTFVVPENGSVRVLCGHNRNSCGTVWFDDVQLEKGYGVSSYNMTENSALTNGATAWSGGTSESAASNLLSGFNAYYHIKGDASKANQLMHNKTEVYNGKKNDVYSFGAWVKADSAPVNNIRGNDSCQPKFCVALQFYNSSGASVGRKTVDVNCDVTSWQFVAGEAIAPSDYSSVRIETDYGNNVNDAYTVGAFVYREEFGQTYTYDDNGNLKSAKEIGASQSAFSYNGNRLAKLLNPSGSKYLYSYNDNNTLASAVSTDGVGYDFKYDAKGNATSAMMKSFKYATALSTGVEYYIRNAESGNCLDTTQTDYVRNYRFKDGKAGQKWSLVATDEAGVYYLRSPDHGGWNLKVSGGVNEESRALVAEDGTGNNYKFKLQANGDGTFRILTKVSNFARCADGQSGSSTNYDDGGIIRQTTYSANDTSQRWYFYPVRQEDDTAIEASATYTADKNFTKTVTDAAGGVTTYFNNTNSGVLTSVRDPLSNVTSYTYDKSNRVTQTTGPVMGGNAAQSYVKYTYSQDRLTQIDANGLVKYNFAYDKFGRSTSVSVGNGSSSRTLASYSYNSKNLPEKITYGNGTVKNNTYNSLDKLTAVSYNGSNTRKAEYFYGSDGNLAQVIDRSANVRRLPVYDLSDRLVSVKEFSGASLESRNVRSSVDYTYADKTNYITHKRYSLPQENTVISSTFTYGNASSGQMPDAVYSIQSASTLKRTYEYDSLGRRTQENVYIGDKLLFKNAYSFASSSVDADDDFARSTNLIRMYSTKTGWYGYTYDANGNMSSMLFNKTGGTMNGVWYYYDGLNRLSRINDNIVGKTYTYSYDANGNITSKTECDYTTKDIPADATRINYTYDSTWKDLLVQYGSKSITYDAIGNPTRIGDSTLTWTGRQLDSYSDGTNNCSFIYDINGQRYKKAVNGTATEYYYGDGKLFAQKTGGRVLLFRYDENDLPIGVTVRENSTRKNYFYVKNVQGDITAIVDSTGNIVSEYSYDVWGKIIGMTDTSDTGIGTANPLRYRGYYYDSETGFYLTGTRYYNPEFGRFINADCYISTGQGLRGINMFAYSLNNPVNMSDPTGEFAISATICGVALWKIGAVFIGALATVLIADTLVKNPPTFPHLTLPKTETKAKSETEIKDLAPALPKNRQRDPVHHIVAKADPRAAEARQILRDVGIEPVIDTRNLVVLPQKYHVSLHTTAYHKYITERLRPVAGNKEAIEATLAALKLEILARSETGIRWD